MAGIGGCPSVGGVCIGCTMPGFPDKFMPFLEEPPGAQLSTTAVVMYGKTVRALRNFTRASLNNEPSWRNPNGKHSADKGQISVPILEPAAPD
jgi:hydrogenase small subunit